MDTPVDYELLAQQIEALAQADDHWLPVLSNASACLFEAMDNINWAGFYVVDEATRGQETPELRLGPFQGKVACVRIPFGRGVCGTAAAEGKTQLVPDVHAFLGHIACDAASRSEVVVPLSCEDRVVAVLDIDSSLLGRFSAYDARGLESFVRALEDCTCWNGL